MKVWHFAILALSVLAPSGWADLPPLIPRTILFGNPEKASPQISPDGKYLAYVAPDDRDVLQVWVRNLESPDKDRKITADKKRGIRTFFWTYHPEELIYSQDSDGDENYHLLSAHIQTGQVRDLTPFQGVRAQLVDVDPDFPDQVLVGLNLKARAKFDVYRVNLKSGAVDLDTENPGTVVGWTADNQQKVRVAVATTPDGGTDLLYRDRPGEPWRTLRHWDADDQGGPAGFSPDNKSLYLQANHNANTQRLIALDLATEKETILAEDSHYDVGGVMFHPRKRNLQAVSFQMDKVAWQALDLAIAPDFAALAKLRPGQFSILSRDLADRTWIVAYLRDDGPVLYVKYERLPEGGLKSATDLFTQQPKLEGLSLSPMQSISFKSRDGLTVHGYLSLPVGIPHKNLPTVLLVHGGPWARDSWGYSSNVQWLANRGYAVLQINFRGSTGYGKKFLNAGNREWAAKMHDDLLDGVDWLVKKGISDPKKIGIMGGSYGGYATLVALSFTPDVFACGVDIVGPSNLITLLKTVPPYWGPMRALFARRVGDLEKEEDFLKSRSPLFFVDRIKAPLLIGQGANDPRVKQAESDQIVTALRSAGKPVEYVLYSDEGHGFARPENRLHFYAIAEQFLARHLGGRAEPVGDIKGHAGTVK